MTETSQPDNGRAWAIGDGQPLEPSTWAHGEVITIRPRTSLADQIEDLLHEFDDVESKRIIAEEIVNRLLGETETEWGLSYPSGLLFGPYRSREAAEDNMHPGATLRRHEVTPWVEVPHG
jgi:hypothetical protein